MHSSRMRTVRYSGRVGDVCLDGVYLGECTPPDPEADTPYTLWQTPHPPLDPEATDPPPPYPTQRDTDPQTHPPDPEGNTSLVNRITDRCKNITFPQLLFGTVIKSKGSDFAFLICIASKKYSS